MKKRMIQLLVVLFVGVNAFLVIQDDEGKVERVAYINSWTEGFRADMYERLEIPGVLEFVSEEQVYFDENLGSFQEFLVEEGGTVSVGDPLYTYRVDNYFESESKLLHKIEEIEAVILAIENAITNMEMHQMSNAQTDNSTSFNITEEGYELDVELPESTIESNLLKQQYLVEKEKELAQQNAELSTLENQLESLRETGDTIMVESPYEGRVKVVNESLDAPIITIENTTLHAVGEFTEDERIQIEQGMAVNIRLNELEQTLEGVLGNVGDSPKSIEIAGESIYPFAVEFTVEPDTTELFPGLHADLSIILEESLDATVLFQDAVILESVWKMTENGKLSNQPVETGILMNNSIEIMNGVQIGEWIALDSKKQFRNGATFITPLKVNQLSINSLALNSSNWKKYLLTGLISR